MTRTPEFKSRLDDAVELGNHLLGTPYGTGWRAGTWPAGPSLYSRFDKQRHTIQFMRNNPMICAAFINVLRGFVFDLPAAGREQGDAFPGGTAAYGRHLAYAPGTRKYPPVENTPRFWLCWSPYLGAALNLQGHIGMALGNGLLLEARVPTLSKNRTEAEVSSLLTRFGGRPFLRIIPPEIWAKPANTWGR